MHAVIFAGGTLQPGEAVTTAIAAADLIIAADSGAAIAFRYDHSIANILLLAGFPTVPIRIVDGPADCWLLSGPGSAAINGQPGDLLSLFPLTGEAENVRTKGLYYPLHGEALRFGKSRGVSNVLTDEQAEVSLDSGLLLIIHTNSRELKT